MESQQTSGRMQGSALEGGKFLTFQLSQEQYAVQILRVTEIIGVADVTRVPRCASHVLGVINLRGRIIPLIDLRVKFGIPPVEWDDKTCIIVMNVSIGDQKTLLGVVVDTVLDVIYINAEQMTSSPHYGVALKTDFVQGMAKLSDSRVAIMLDINRILLSEEALTLSEA